MHFLKQENDAVRFSFGHKGNNVQVSVYSQQQYELSKHMPEPVKIDSAKVILSPMPGAIVDVFVQPGDAVVEGQQLAIIEAMKMQNILKAERVGTVKAVNVAANDSVAVDELLIEFE